MTPVTTTRSSAVDELRRLITSGRAALVGPIRQEILSGIREPAIFERLRDQLRAFPDETIAPADYERATEFFNTCRSKGLQGSNTDFLLCAVSAGHRMPIFTTDDDFTRYGKVLPLLLHRAG